VEVTRSSRVRDGDLASLRRFLADYPSARAVLVYAGTRASRDGSIEIVPAQAFFTGLGARLS
jgi:hypothetical protein